MNEPDKSTPELSFDARTALWIALRAPDSYGLVLLLLIVNFFLTPHLTNTQWLWVGVLLQGATMLFALHTSRVHRKTMRAAAVVFLVCLLVALEVAIAPGRKQAEAETQLLTAILFALCVPAMLRHILSAGQASIETVIGALDVYIMFGMFFASVYASLAAWSSTPFFAQPATVTGGSYQFFSFVTLTTVGYGNLVPATQTGQSLAVLEALFGQVYLVTLVARLVSGLQPGGRRRAVERLAAEREARDGKLPTDAEIEADVEGEAADQETARDASAEGTDRERVST